jgi:hypothetical protein
MGQKMPQTLTKAPEGHPQGSRVDLAQGSQVQGVWTPAGILLVQRLGWVCSEQGDPLKCSLGTGCHPAVPMLETLSPEKFTHVGSHAFYIQFLNSSGLAQHRAWHTLCVCGLSKMNKAQRSLVTSSCLVPRGRCFPLFVPSPSCGHLRFRWWGGVVQPEAPAMGWYWCTLEVGEQRRKSDVRTPGNWKFHLFFSLQSHSPDFLGTRFSLAFFYPSSPSGFSFLHFHFNSHS